MKSRSQQFCFSTSDWIVENHPSEPPSQALTISFAVVPSTLYLFVSIDQPRNTPRCPFPSPSPAKKRPPTPLHCPLPFPRLRLLPTRQSVKLPHLLPLLQTGQRRTEVQRHSTRKARLKWRPISCMRRGWRRSMRKGRGAHEGITRARGGMSDMMGVGRSW